MARTALAQYFADIADGIVSTWKGMTLTLGYLFKKPVTMMYPEVRPEIPEGHRGLHHYDEDACTLCMQCAAVCPVSCIAIEALGRGKEGLKLRYDIDYSKCLFCNLCCEACKPGCLYMGPEYDRAAATRDGCLAHLARTKSPEEIEAFKALLVQRELEKKAKAEAAMKAKQEAEAAAKASKEPNLDQPEPKRE